MKSLLSLIPLLLLFLGSCKTPKIVSGQVILARHAERDKGVDDLNARGEARATKLADMLAEAGISAIYCSEYHRTQATAQPLCEALGLKPIIYDAKNLPLLAEEIKQRHANKTVLVIGHSNTVPSTINAFGVSPALGDLEHDEYSNLYILNYGKENRLILLKFGEK